MAPFRAKIGRKGMRMGENKNYRIVPFRSEPMQNSKCKKKAKKFKKLKIPLWYHFKPKLFGKCQESEKIKIIVSFRSIPTRRGIENAKKKKAKN